MLSIESKSTSYEASAGQRFSFNDLVTIMFEIHDYNAVFGKDNTAHI